MAGVLGTQMRFEQRAQHEELRGGLGRLARLADDVDERAIEPWVGALHFGQHLRDESRVDVVQYEQAGAVALLSRHEVPRQRTQCRVQRDVAKCAAADAQHDEVLGAGAMLAGELVHGAEVVAAHRISPQVAPPLVAGARCAIQIVDDGGEVGTGGRESIGGQPCGADAFVETVRVVKRESGHGPVCSD